VIFVHHGSRDSGSGSSCGDKYRGSCTSSLAAKGDLAADVLVPNGDANLDEVAPKGDLCGASPPVNHMHANKIIACTRNRRCRMTISIHCHICIMDIHNSSPLGCNV
jgi:hypothetical protein